MDVHGAAGSVPADDDLAPTAVELLEWVVVPKNGKIAHIKHPDRHERALCGASLAEVEWENAWYPPDEPACAVCQGDREYRRSHGLAPVRPSFTTLPTAEPKRGKVWAARPRIKEWGKPQ